MKHLMSLTLFILLSTVSAVSLALENKTFCVWDPVGRSGPVMTFYSDVIPKAQSWGLNIRFKAYTEESDVVDQFKAGNCEAAVLTSILSRQFVKFAGTMDAIGAINSKKGLELAIATLSRERAGKLMAEGNYEVVTTFPVGSMYAFVKDRNVDTIDEFAGKKIAVLNKDPQMYKFANLSSSIPVSVTLSNFAEKFRTGELDIVIMPALAYNTFELYEGLGANGGIIDYRLYYGMLQTIARRDQFPENFGSKMRNYMLTRMKAMNKMVSDAEEEIPKKYWIKTNQFVKDEIDHFSKRIRLALQEDDVNNPTALKLFWKIRCRLDPSRGECKTPPSTITQRKKIQEKNKREAEQLAAQQREKARLEAQRKESERLAKEAKKAEAARIAKQKTQQEKLRLEQERLARQKLEEEKRVLEAKLKEQKRREQEQKAAEQRIAAEKLALEKERAELARQKLALSKVDHQDNENEQLDLAKDDDVINGNTVAKQEVDVNHEIETSEENEDEQSWSLWDFLFGWI